MRTAGAALGIFFHSCSVGCNAAHGQRRSNDDKRLAVSKLLKDKKWGKWSDREIAKRCHVSHTFVDNLRTSLATDASDERTYKTKHPINRLHRNLNSRRTLVL